MPSPVIPPPGIDVQGQDNAAYGAASPGNKATTVAAGPAGVPPASYVIVRSSVAPHDTLQTAQDLPNVPYFGVIGTLGSEDSIDLFRMTISPGTPGFQFELVSQQQASQSPVQFSLFDGSGRVLGTWSSGNDPSPSPISVDLSNPSLGPTLFLGISAASPSPGGPAGPSPPINYQLWVTSLPAPGRQTAGAGDAVNALPTSFLPLIVSSVSLSATPFPAGVTPPGLAPIPSVGGGGLPQAVGGLPTRSASPLGGVLADDNPTTTAVHLLTVRANVAKGAQTPSTSGLDPEQSDSSWAELGEGADPKAPVALRGPGGFPLLGAAAIGNWRRTSTAVAAAPAEPPSLDQIDAQAVDLLAVQDHLSQTAEPPAGSEADPEADPGAGASRPRSWGESRVTLSFGLSMATALTLNVVLSDPVAGFDYLATRLDPNVRKSSRGRRPSGEAGGR
jgi:hypothetical protein